MFFTLSTHYFEPLFCNSFGHKSFIGFLNLLFRVYTISLQPPLKFENTGEQSAITQLKLQNKLK
jgi:hypothetical protein